MWKGLLLVGTNLNPNHQSKSPIEHTASDGIKPEAINWISGSCWSTPKFSHHLRVHFQVSPFPLNGLLEDGNLEMPHKHEEV